MTAYLVVNVNFYKFPSEKCSDKLYFLVHTSSMDMLVYHNRKYSNNFAQNNILIPVSLPGKSHGQEQPVRLWSMGVTKVSDMI